MDWASALLQAILTVIIGVTVYALGQVAVKFFIEPLDKLSETIGEVLDTLVYYSNIYTNPVIEHEPIEMTTLRKDAEKTLRQKATLLLSKASRVRLYGFASFFRVIPPKKNIIEAHKELIFLSNSCFSGNPEGTFKSAEKIKILLISRKAPPSIPDKLRVPYK